MVSQRAWWVLTVLLLVPGGAQAFHEGGVAECAGCHVMHGGGDSPSSPVAGLGGEPLLLASNASDTCLRCHAAYGQFASGLGFGPGGDFYWVTRTWTWVAGGAPRNSPGAAHGHNVVAPAYGLAEDPLHATAPGGSFPSRDLGCTSCHDPHGTRAFAMLWGSGAGPAVTGGRFPFTNPAPLARGNGPFTIAGWPRAGDETNARHTVYLSGMSAWCANCHGPYHDAGGTGFAHPSGERLEPGHAGQYNRYAGAADPTGGTVSTSYWGLVPFEAPLEDPALVEPNNATAGPDADDQVMCLSCHRAHASPYRAAGRWDFDAETMSRSHPLLTDGGATAADGARKDYSYLFVPAQGTLCQKCHRDVPGGPPVPPIQDTP